MLMVAVTEPIPGHFIEELLFYLAFTSPLWLPALWVLLRVRARPRRNLALAAGLGWTVFASALVVALLAGFQEPDPELFILCGLYAVIHFGLTLAARLASRQLPPQQPPVRVWPAAALGVALPLVFVSLLILPVLLIPQHPPTDAWVVADLRSINTAAVIYQSSYGGYPPSLAVLGPPPEGKSPDCRAVGLIDPALASGAKRHYLYIYSPGAPADSNAAGCPPGVKAYTVSARPKEFGKPGRIRSFFTDESAVIRFTRDDRPATPSDPPID